MALIFSYFVLLQLFSISLNHHIVYADVISCDPAGPFLKTCDGTDGDDIMEGDSERNSIYGFGGDDKLIGGAGNDALHGGPGDDELTGGAGNDLLFGSPGEDSFDCGLGDDQIIHFNLSEGDTKSKGCESIWP
jgi:Ca2+-binding RTX toxin-like protein